MSSSNETVRPFNKIRYYSVTQPCDIIIIHSTYKWENKHTIHVRSQAKQVAELKAECQTLSC